MWLVDLNSVNTTKPCPECSKYFPKNRIKMGSKHRRQSNTEPQFFSRLLKLHQLGIKVFCGYTKASASFKVVCLRAEKSYPPITPSEVSLPKQDSLNENLIQSLC